MFDIILEGVLIYQTQHLFPHYLMKHTLPDWLGLYGGIHVVRQRDVPESGDRRRNVAALRRAKQAHQRSVRMDSQRDDCLDWGRGVRCPNRSDLHSPTDGRGRSEV